MDAHLGRLEALEQHVQTLTQQASSVARRLRWWRRLACSAMVLAVFSLPISLGADDRRRDDRNGEKPRGNHTEHDRHDDKDDKELRKLRERIRALERKLQHVTSERDENGLPQLVITGANLRIVNGVGSTACVDEQSEPIPGCPNGLGNLIVGYNEPRAQLGREDNRTGSHNIVVGQFHSFSSTGGLVGGAFNTISAEGASITGGVGSTASANFAAVSGGSQNIASGTLSSVTGGELNTANNDFSSVSGGASNTAGGIASSVSGGQANRAGGPLGFGPFSSVSGGGNNTASGIESSVSGGGSNTASGTASSVTGGLFNTASNSFSSVGGGAENTASGEHSSVSGGLDRSAAGLNSWAAGALFQNQ